MLQAITIRALKEFLFEKILIDIFRKSVCRILDAKNFVQRDLLVPRLFLHPEVRAVVEEKNILLFQEMLRDISYDDMGVVENLVDKS